MSIRLKRKRIWLFRVIALLIPFLLLVVLELALRLFHYGYDTSLFIESPENKDYWVMNPEASKKYFTDQLNATTGNREPFRKVKGPDVFRVFVLGESTTIGYPYFHNGSFHRWLLYRLMSDHPDKKIEMVNVSLTAVNSYTVLGFSKEIVRYQPDAVLIYTGHNEYYGALGVGSTNRIGGSPRLVNFLLRLREYKVVQLMTRMIGGMARIFSSDRSKSGKTRMELMVADQQIGYGSPPFFWGIDQFRVNMDEALGIYSRAHVPVFFSNLVSNEKDLRPFVSLPDGSRMASTFRQQYNQGKQALGAGDSVAAARYFSTADQIDSSYAQCRYYLGGLAYARGDFSLAARYYESARELDGLRFRAPDSINGVIRELCGKYGNVHLVDARAAFSAASEHGVIGNALILEHVHPNLLGYALLSDVFYTAMKEQKIIEEGKEISFEQLLRDMPITAVDSLNGAYRIDNLKHYWPFSDSAGAVGLPSRDVLHVSGPEEELAYEVAFEHLPWEEAMSRLYEYYGKRADWKNAIRVMQAMVLEHPNRNEYRVRVAMLYLRQDRPLDAMPYLDYAIKNNTQELSLQRIRLAAMEVIRLQADLAKDSISGKIRDSIAHWYRGMGNKDAALKYEKGFLRP
jgi:tetratricopeptide (TPR) repeat protein